ncbi:MAG: hypothetical protein JOZ81_23945 [Chloroflexi bacterium]|nr:hypothetical protein [Chloroflexota bacterium]
MSRPRVALLGLTYKPGTDTLRRSYAVELARSLVDRGVAVQAYDPAVHRLPDELSDVRLTHSLADVLDNADVAVLATEWPEFKALDVDFLVQKMRFPRLIDQTGFLSQLGSDDRIQYVRVGRPRRAGVLA